MASLLVSEERREELRALAREWPAWTVAGADLADLEALLRGFLAPLRGYGVGAADEAGHPAGLPLGVPPEVAELTPAGARLALKDPEGVLLAVLHVEERSEREGAWQLAGPVEGIELPAHDDFSDLRLSPEGVAARVRALGYQQTLAFWAGPVLHAGIRAALVAAAEQPEAGLLLLIASEPAEHDELADFSRIRAVEVSARRLPPERTTVAVVPLSSRGDAAVQLLRQALVARNCEAKLFAVDVSGLDTAAVAGLDAAADRLDTKVAPIRAWSYDPATQAFVEPAAAEPRALASPPLREILSWSAPLPEWLLSPEETDALRRAHVPRSAQGFTVFLTGLSGSGKSTIARALRVRLLERTGRPVSLLDGDRVRRHLSSELGFSREHRDLNILRIGWVASEITRHGGIAICAPIAPYDRIRQRVRTMVEGAGGFLLVHVSTPLETCEARDRKGLYAKARAGVIQQFTGISDPYERPPDADLTIDTRETDVKAACERIVGWLEQSGYVAARGTGTRHDRGCLSP